MVSLPLLGELQHLKSAWHEGAVYWMNGHGLSEKTGACSGIGFPYC